MKAFIDKIAEQALNKCNELGINNPSRREAFVGGYRYGLREGKNPWRKVSEELPEPLTYVIVRFSNNTMAVSQRTNHFIGETTTVKVTHWMELPEVKED